MSNIRVDLSRLVITSDHVLLIAGGGKKKLPQETENINCQHQGEMTCFTTRSITTAASNVFWSVQVDYILDSGN